MAGFPGNVGWVMAQKQTAKGTPAAPAVGTTFKNPLVGGGLAPARAIAELAETDASRDRGVSYVQNESIGGAPEIYIRDSSIGLYLLGVLGADAVTGTTPNFTHTFTPSNTLPYFTFWRDVADLLWEQYQDVKVSQVVFAASAGSPLTATATVAGVKSTRLTVDPSIGPPLIPIESAFVYNFNNATVQLSGGVTALVHSFSLTIDNNVTNQQTDDVFLFDVVEGQRQISLDFDLIFTNLDEYNKFHYGSTVGTAQTPAIYTTSADFQFDNGANNQVKFTLPSIAYNDFPVNVNPNGEPISVAVRAVGQRSGSPIVTATVKNQTASYG